MTNKSICFVSYSREDIDRETLEYLEFLLNQHSEGAYDVLVDEGLSYGANLVEFMGLLASQVNAVIILMSPSYRRKVIERTGGVYEEYKLIMNRYHELQEQKQIGKKSGEIRGYFGLFPILFSGTKETSVPHELRNIKYPDFVGLRAFKDARGHFKVAKYIYKKYVPDVLKIAESLRVISALKSHTFDQLYDEYFSRLFIEVKADWTNERDREHNYTETLFVKTKAYKKVETQAVYFIIGRKGSGKTTIRDLLAIQQKDKYIGHVAIEADDFNLGTLYSLFEPQKIRSDLRNIFSRLECFSFAWEAFILMCCMAVLLKARKTLPLNSYQKRLYKPIVQFLQNVSRTWFLGQDFDKNAYFVYCFNLVVEFLEDCIQGARSDSEHFFSDVQARFSRPRFLNAVFGETVLESFNTIIKTISNNFLISLDGFDSAFDVFRRDSLYVGVEVTERSKFEVDWLRSFVQLVLRMKQLPNPNNPLYAHAEFCVTVPHDRFMEVSQSERDSFRYYNRFLSLRWSGIELAMLLRKRLEELTQTSTDKRKSPDERLNQILRQHFKHIPLDIIFMFNGKQYQMPLFMYVLRHTFWRPREILLYYAQIIAVSEMFRRKHEEIGTEVLRRIVKDVTTHIINREFINEFDSSVNIREIINAFAEQKQVLTYKDVEGILEDINFKFASGSPNPIATSEKIEFLYRIGFLGVYADDQMVRRLNLGMKHAFFFNEGDAPLRTIGAKGFNEYRFIIHPIFSEYLGLDTSENEFIMNFSWKYLHDMEALQFA